MDQELWDIQAGLTNDRGTRDQIANICWIIEKTREFQKSVSLTTLKSLTVWVTTNCGKFLKSWGYQTTLSAFWETCMQVKKQQLELDGTTDSFQIGKGERQGYILSSSLFNLYTECVCVLVAQSCPTLCDPMDCNPPGSSVHEIFQARILEWVAISFSRGSS